MQAQQKGAAAAGKQPFFLKAGDKRKLELVSRYAELSAAGQLDRFMEKRRKHNASKDHRYVPSAAAGVRVRGSTSTASA